MTRPIFAKDEFKIVGTYPGIERFAVMGAQLAIPESPKYNRPITQRENWRLLLGGENPIGFRKQAGFSAIRFSSGHE